MKKISNILSVILAIVMVLSIIPITASAVDLAGNCGDNLTWSFNETTGTLTISGEGAMYDFPYDDSSWFDLKYEIKNVVIEDGVTTIGSSAFELFVNLKNVTIPESVTSIGAYAFNSCDSLAKVVLHEGVKEIGDGAFSHCDYLDTVVIPGTVTSFGEYVFAHCEKLANVTIGNGITDLGTDAFTGCISLTDIVIPDGVASLRGGNFEGCENLKSVTIPVSLTTVAYGVFDGCTNLQDVYYTGTEAGWSNIDDYGNNDPLFNATVHYNSTVHAHNYVKRGEYVAKTCDEDGYTTYTCECGLSYNADYVKATDHNYDDGVVTTEPSCTVDGVKTFTCAECGDTYTEPVSQTGHSYDNGVITADPTCTTDGVKTFTCGNCGDTYTEAVDKTGQHSYQLTENATPDTTGCVKTYKCKVCGDTYSETVSETGHTKVIIPLFAPTATTSGLTAGVKCSGCGAVLVEQQIIPALGTNDDASKLVSGTCGTNATWTFNTETGTLTISGTGATTKFKSTQSRPWENYEDDIKSIIIENGITKIDNYAFRDCSNLVYVSIPDSVTTIVNYVFRNCDSLTGVIIPDSVTSMGDEVFKSCDNLVEVKLSDNLSTINSNTFSGCSSLINITIPEKINTIYSYAFDGCTTLTDVYYAGTEEQWNKISIAANNDSLTTATIHYNNTGDSGAEHIHNYTVVTVNPTCTEKGSTTYTCGCGDVYTFTYKALGHSEQEIPLILPTTESVGYTKGKKCTTCDEFFVAPVEVPVLNETTTAGDAGGYIIWTYDDETKTLEFYGNGEIPEYEVDHSSSNYTEERPWPTYWDITYIVLHEGITEIGSYAFYDFTQLKKITLPSTLTFVGEYAFYDCRAFTIHYLGTREEWEQVRYYASGNSNFTNAKKYFSDYNGVTASGTHGDNLTWSYDGLNFTLTISGTGAMEEVDYREFPWYEYFTDIENIVIEDGVTTIASYAFYMYRFKNITIPDTLTTIGMYAFYDCNYFKSITIPVSVTTIDDFAFQSADGIEDVYYLGTEQQWNNIAIGSNNTGLYYLTTIHFSGFTGIKGDYFYKDDVRMNAYQLIEHDGDFYYISDCHKIARNKTYYFGATSVEGFTYADGTPLQAGYYTFGEDGKMIMLNGPVGDYLYKNNVRMNAYQLVEYDGDFYYISDCHRIARNKTYYFGATSVEGFTYADGTPLQAGYYTFGEDGKMIMLNGPVGDYLYKNNVRMNAYQLVEYDGDFYYISDGHKIARNKTYYFGTTSVEGFTYADGTPLQAGYYTFGEDGKMVMLNGPVGDYLYKNNVRMNAYQLVEYDGDFYYISDCHKIARNKSYYFSAKSVQGFNYADGTPLEAGWHSFDAEGKLIRE